MWLLFMYFEMWCDYVLRLERVSWIKCDHGLKDNQNVNCVKSDTNAHK